MKEVKISIPDNCELVKEGDSYIVKEKKNNPPRSWNEFCKNYPINFNECWITGASNIAICNIPNVDRDDDINKNICINKEEAEAFLALMQLRQLRKAWIGDFVENTNNGYWNICYSISLNKIHTSKLYSTSSVLTFPTEEMAKDFVSCFKELCETAKILL